MANESKIVPYIIGAINTQEQFSKVYINCVEPDATSGTVLASGLEASKPEILFPPKAKSDKKIPLIGGSIVKIELNLDEISTSKSDNPHRIGRYAGSGLNAYATNIPTIEGYQKLSDLLEARVKINKALESMPNITSGWHKSGVPTLQLSTLRSESIESASDLDSEIDKKKRDNIRVSGLNKVGGFKFIPIEILYGMLNDLTDTGDDNKPGLKDYVGLSGETFGKLAEYMSGKPTDDQLVSVLLDLLPVFHIDEEYIDGEDAQPVIGYFTAYEKSLYVKMPDLSGRDSSGYSSNIYGESNEEQDDYISFCFELKKRKEYAAVAIDYIAPPVPEVSDGQPTYPDDEEEITISIEKDGFDHSNKKYKYFLSPIMGYANAPKARGFRTVTDAVEVFPAPLVTKPFKNAKEGSPIIDVTNESIKEDLKEVYERLVSHLWGTDGAFHPQIMERKAMTEDILASQNLLVGTPTSGSINIYTFDTLGIPISVSASEVGVDSASDLLGEVNRPEMLLGMRESGDDDASIRRNDRKFFNHRASASKDILASNRPNYITDLEDYSQIPKLWMELEKSDQDDEEDSDNFLLKIPFKSTKNTHGMDIYDSAKKHEFALYIIDELGQVIRAPGQNIEVFPQAPEITKIKPNGYRQDGAVFEANAALGCMTLYGSSIKNVSSVNVFSDEGRTQLVGTLRDGDTFTDLDGIEHTVYLKERSDKIEVCSTGTLQTVLGTANTGAFHVSVQLENGETTSRTVPIYIAEPETLVADLPPEPGTQIRFPSPDGLKALKFGSMIDSVPILMDGGTSEIRLKYKKKVFQEGAELYAYIAIAQDSKGDNEAILEEDVGWMYQEGIHTKNAIVSATMRIGSEDKSFLIPTSLEYSLGSSDFSYINKRKVKLKFPGSKGASANLSRFPELVGHGDDSPSAYIVLTRRKLSQSGNVSFPNEDDYAYIPLGNGSSKKAFVTPPYVVGLVMELRGTQATVRSNCSKSILNTKAVSEAIKGIDINALDAEAQKLITTDKIKRLAVIFQGPNEERRLSRSYTGYIGSKKIKKYRAGRVKRAGDGKLVLNYKNIKSITAEGWTDIIVSKKDRRFRTTYDSTLYNRSTVRLWCPTHVKPQCIDIVDGSPVVEQESAGTTISVLASGKNRVIPEANGFKFDTVSSDLLFSASKSFADSSYVFPKRSKSGWDPLPFAGESYDGDSPVSDASAYYYFSNPIKIRPNVDLEFGYNDESDPTKPRTYGMSLSDSPVDSEGLPADEIVKINTSGSTEVEFSIAAAEAVISRLKEQGEAVSETINDTVSSLEALKEVEGLTAEQLEALDSAIHEAQGKQTDFNEAAAAADASVAQGAEAEEALAAAHEAAALAAGEGPSASDIGAGIAQGVEDVQETLDDVVGAVNDGVQALEDGLAALQGVIDQLSSIANLANQLAEGLEGMASAMGPRPDDFTKVNIKHIYIDKDSAIPAPMEKEDGLEHKLVTTYRFTQTAAIKFNVPEIVAIWPEKESGPKNAYVPSGEKMFNKLSVTTGSKLIIRTIGATRDTKLEVAGKRIKATKAEPFNDVEQTFEVIMPDLNKFSLFGSSPCVSLALTNSNENRIRAARQLGNDIAVNLDDKWSGHIFGGKRNKQGDAKELKDKISLAYLKFTSVTLDKANIAKEFLQSFCDMSFHLTAELSLQLRNFKVLLIPIKVILCIIDVICALLHPIRLAFAIIRLFLCLYDLILLLPQLSVPAMYLAMLLHLIELLLCVILKILGIINAINEIITAFENAIEQKNYPACVALEETINEHIFSLEADLSVLDPILTILALFLELLQLIFSFPCQVGADEDDEACIDPSQLAGIIVGKVAPFGRIEPDALLPLAQAYTRLPVDQAKSTGNSPPDKRDNNEDMDCRENATSDNICSHLITLGDNPDFIAQPQAGATVSKGETSGGDSYAGNTLTGLKDSVTGEFKQVEEGGWFSGDIDGSGEMDNIQYPKLRFQSDLRDPVDSSNYNGDEYIGGAGDYFDATFGLSFTRSTKKFSIFTGPDPRIVSFDFNSRGETSDVSWWWKILLFPLFFRKKLISELQTLDSPPMFLTESGGELVVDGSGSGNDFVSPIDGATGFLESKGSGYQPKPLTVTFELNEPGVNPDTLSAEFTPVEVTKTFGNIPMIALVDDAFNVYFVEEDGSDGGIKMDGNKIESINVKMINHPSAPKKKFGREEMEVYRDFEPKSGKAEALGSSTEVSGEKVIQAQANAMWLISEYERLNPTASYEPGSNSQAQGMAASWAYDTATKKVAVPSTIACGWDGGPFTFDSTDSDHQSVFENMPFPDVQMAYDFSAGNKKEANDIGNAIDSVKVFDFPRFYIVDMRQVADDIAAACGASGPMELLLDLPGFEDTDDLEDGIGTLSDCLEAFLNHFNSDEEGEDGKPVGLIPKMRFDLQNGIVPERLSVPDIVTKYDTLKECVEDQIGKTCRFVLNPLNTSLMLLNDEDETPLPNFIDPEQKDLEELASFDIVDELEYDEGLEGFPSITGAMEYASGIGDSAIVEVGAKALIRIIPRDCYDEELPPTLDLTESIKIEFIKDETGSAELVEVTDGEGDIYSKDDGQYTVAISAESPGKVQVRASVCSVVIQAVTDRGIVDPRGSEGAAEVDCVDDAAAADEEVGFAPGALMKVDRILTILFVPSSETTASSRYGDADREESARSSKPSPQTFGTKLEN